MPYGMPAGFAELIRRKYDILQQQADANTMAARAGAGLDNTRAGLLPSQVQAEIARQQAEARLTNENARQVAPLAASSIGLQSAQARNQIAGAGLYGSQATAQDQLNTPLGFGAFKLTPSLDRLRKIMAEPLRF